MSPITDHTHDLDAEEQAHDLERAAAKTATHIAIAKEVDPLDEAFANLTAAVESGDVEAIGRSQLALEQARDQVQRDHQKRKDLEIARQAAAKIKAQKDRVAAQELSAKVEKRVRAKFPVIRLDAPGGRTLVIRLGSADPALVTECTRRAVLAMSNALTNQVIASRSLGRTVPCGDWLSSLETDESGGVFAHIRAGICRVEKRRKKS